MKFLSYGVMIYMLLALVWWSILLTRNNDLLYLKSIEIFNSKIVNSQTKSNISFSFDEENKMLKKDYLKKKYMILGEGLVFGITLIIGIWFIQKAYIQELENTKKQKNFLLSVTHELKSPITAINLVAETLQKRKLPSDIASEMYESILGETKRLESLVSNLLMAANLDNTYTYNFEKCNLGEIAEKVIKSIKMRQPTAEVLLNDSLGKQVADCDRESMISVLTNLIENSIKYSNKPAFIKIDLESKHKNIELRVSDSGYGIPEKEKSKVMQQFYRIGSEETRQTKGTGLGLYIVSKIIDAHKGSLKITDNKPKGSIFNITLPQKQRV